MWNLEGAEHLVGESFELGLELEEPVNVGGESDIW